VNVTYISGDESVVFVSVYPVDSISTNIILYNVLWSRLLSKNIKIRIYKTIILPVVLYGCETWSLTLRE
jgi:hypothetical protein